MRTMELLDVPGRLEELILWVSRGEEIVLTDAGRWVALLTEPPEQPTSERDAEITAAIEESVREMVRARVAQGVVIDEDSPLRRFVDAP